MAGNDDGPETPTALPPEQEDDLIDEVEVADAERAAADAEQSSATEAERTAPDADRTGSEAEQRGSDRDQAASDRDQVASDRDQAASNRDQVASDRDQAASDRDHAAADRNQTTPHPDPAVGGDYETSRRERQEGTEIRDHDTALRERASDERDLVASRRDDLARMRDLAAEARDHAAAGRDVAAMSHERDAEVFAGLDEAGRRRLTDERARVIDARVRATADRERAARDREEAARNRGEAAQDREQASSDRRHAAFDELTGVYMRGTGLITLQRELERSRRTGSVTCLAFIDVDGLKEVNDRDGHAAGDRLLRAVAGALKAGLRPYDPIVRMGGDEFACAISDSDLATSRKGITRIAAELRKGPLEASISLGLVAVGSGESLADALARADADLLRSRARR